MATNTPELPKITVYIPSHNYGAYLERAIESVLRQTCDNWELLIINDGSTDQTAQILERYEYDPRIRTLTTPGIGLLKVCNLALQQARGEYLIRLDGDDYFDDNILLVLANQLDRDPNIALVFPDYYLIDEFGEVFSHEQRQRLYEKNHIIDMPPHGACTLIRSSILRDIGGYPEHINAQDGFFVWSKVYPRYKAANVNLPLFYYRRHDTNLTNVSSRILEARRQIKRDTSIISLDQARPFIAVIPCRRYYDFAPNLWGHPFGDTTLLERSIQTCLDSSILDHIVVTSDTAEVQTVLERYQDPRLSFFLRDTKETIRTRSIVPSLEAVALHIDPRMQGITVLVKLQTPFLTTDTIEESIFTVLMNNADSAVGVQQLDRVVLRRSPHGLIPINETSGIRTDFDTLYVESRAIQVTKNSNLIRGTMHGPVTVHLILDDRECYFIDSQQHLLIAEALEKASDLHERTAHQDPTLEARPD